MNLEARFSAVCHKSDAIEIAHLMYNEPTLIQDCVDLIVANNKKYSHRASWALNTLVEQFESPNLQAYGPALAASFVRVDTLPAILRNLLHIFKAIAFSKEHEGLILDRCFKLLEDPKTAVAIQCMSMETIYRISRGNEFLLEELEGLIQAHLEYGSGAYKSSSKKYLKLIQQNKKAS